MSELAWRDDVENAHTDGTEFLALYLGNPIMCKRGNPTAHLVDGWVGINVRWHDGRGSYVDLRNGWGEEGHFTKWMPLPA